MTISSGNRSSQPVVTGRRTPWKLKCGKPTALNSARSRRTVELEKVVRAIMPI